MSKFKQHYDKLSAEEKRQLAQSLETSVAYLSQIANGHRKAGANFAIKVYPVLGMNLQDLR